MIEPAVSIEEIRFSYGQRNIYEHFSLAIPENDILFVMGVNGCGKTTLLKILCGFLRIQAGKVHVKGRSIYDYSQKAFAQLVSYVPQTLNLTADFLVKDYLVLGRAPYKAFGASYTDEDYLCAEKYAQQLSLVQLLDTPFQHLSGGQKQNVAICRALIQETPILVLDEPMSALDIGHQAAFLALLQELKKAGKTIVLTSHNPNHALCFDSSVCLLQDGKKIGLGKASDVLDNEAVAAVYGGNLRILESGGSRNLVFDFP